jgi:hypothetical protein
MIRQGGYMLCIAPYYKRKICALGKNVIVLSQIKFLAAEITKLPPLSIW